MKQVKFELIEGGIYGDERGELSFVNDFNFKDVVRFYTIKNKDLSVIRAWQGHQYETKYFYVLEGSFLISLILIDDWINPSRDLEPTSIVLTSNKSQILKVPGGYANGIKSLEEESKLIVYSDFTIEQSQKDNFRFESDFWKLHND